MDLQLVGFFPGFVDYLPRIGAAALVLGGFWIAGAVLAHVVRRMTKVGSENILRLIARAIRTTLLVIGFISALGTLGIDVTAMVAGLGLTGFALGFALKDVLSNAVAGVLILFYRPFVLGDRIVLASVDGRVDSIDLRYTTVVNNDGRVLIPNSVAFTEKVLIRNAPE